MRSPTDCPQLRTITLDVEYSTSQRRVIVAALPFGTRHARSCRRRRSDDWRGCRCRPRGGRLCGRLGTRWTRGRAVDGHARVLAGTARYRFASARRHRGAQGNAWTQGRRSGVDHHGARYRRRPHRRARRRRRRLPGEALRSRRVIGARARAATSRCGSGPAADRTRCIDVESCDARSSAARQSVDVSAREFALLLALAERAGSVVSRAQLEEKLYGWNEAVGSNAIEVHVHNLRRKLGESIIRNVRGLGYTLD